jgi:hypothetical protein
MTIFEHANEIIFERNEEKQRQYGPMQESMASAALIASALCNKEITTEDFYKCMMALKLSRLGYSTKRDTILDLIAYAGSLDNFKNGSYKK